jgi:hypothetical protein
MLEESFFICREKGGTRFISILFTLQKRRWKGSNREEVAWEEEGKCNKVVE